MAYIAMAHVVMAYIQAARGKLHRHAACAVLQLRALPLAAVRRSADVRRVHQRNAGGDRFERDDAGGAEPLQVAE